MDYSKLCLKCMHEKVDEKCEHCGFDLRHYTAIPNTIPAPSVLQGRYLVGIPLGIGGFGITYIAFDLKVGGVCAIKEYMPDTVSYRVENEQNVSVSGSKLEGYLYGKNSFIEEAHMLMKFSKSRNVINVFECFEENNTAYYVMEYLDGKDLRTYTDNYRNKLDFKLGLECMLKVMNGLEELHNNDVIHRDISPDNIYITRTGEVKILDFGAARYSVTQKHKNLSVILKMGYAPLEQYSTKIPQGPWTDIYALGATFYHLFSGIQLPEATERSMGERVKNLKEINRELPHYFCDAIDKAISLNRNDRFQSIAEMRDSFSKNSLANSAASYVNKSGTSPIAVYEKGADAVIPQYTSGSNSSKNIFVMRIVAYVIDFILSVFIGVLFILFISRILAEMNMLDGVGTPIMWFITLLTPLLLTLFNSSLESSSLRGTIGKKVTGIQTISVTGNTLTSNDSIKRNFIKLLGIFLLLTEKNGFYLHELKSNSKVISK